MAERKKESLLERVCSYLGFHFEKCSNGFKILDRENKEYKRFLTDDIANVFKGLSEVEDLLKTKTFEHYCFSWNDFYSGLKIVENPFYRMSREHLAIELDLMGA